MEVIVGVKIVDGASGCDRVKEGRTTLQAMHSAYILPFRGQQTGLEAQDKADRC